MAFGSYIVEYGQNGEDRAKYGAKLLEEMAKNLKRKGLKGLKRRELSSCRKFYILYAQIWRMLSAKSENDIYIAPELLLSRLSYSHFVELIKVDDTLQRLFYGIEAIKNNWSVRELERAINVSTWYSIIIF